MNSSYWVTEEPKEDVTPKKVVKKSKWDQKTRPEVKPKAENTPSPVKPAVKAVNASYWLSTDDEQDSPEKPKNVSPVKSLGSPPSAPTRLKVEKPKSSPKTDKPGPSGVKPRVVPVVEYESAEKAHNELAKTVGSLTSTLAGLKNGGQKSSTEIKPGPSGAKVGVVNTRQASGKGRADKPAAGAVLTAAALGGKTEKEPEKRIGSSSRATVTSASSHSKPPLGDSEDIDLEKLRLYFESDHEWSMRKAFIVTHRDKLPMNRLVCLSNCFINSQVYGAQYPPGVMQHLSELKQGLGDVMEKIRARETAKREAQEVKFVKASGSVGAEHESADKPGHSKPSSEVPNSGGMPGIGSFEAALTSIPTSSKRTGKRKSNTKEHPDSQPKMMAFVKSDSEYNSTDMTNQSNIKPEKNLQHAVSYRSTISCEITKKLYTVQDKLIEFKEVKRANSIEFVHLVLGKLKMEPTATFTRCESGHCCEFYIDSILITKMLGTGKKTSKHQAFDLALEKLSKPYLRVVSINPETKQLEASDEPFDSDPKADAAESPAMLTKCGLQEVASRGMKRLHVDAPPIQNFILIEHRNQEKSPNPSAILRQSADFSKMKLTFEPREHGGQCWCRILLEHEVLADFAGATKVDAKNLAAEKALEKLKRSCWTIKIKKNEDTDSLQLSRDEVLGEISEKSEKVIDSGIGNKLLKMMGWAGGGIGKTGSGIAEPVKADGAVINRQGLGLAAEKGIGSNFVKSIKDVVSDYVRSNRQDDLAFASSFSKEERAIIHKECQKFGLKTHSHGSGDERYLVASRRRTATQLFSHIMQSGGSTSKYDLFPPESYHHEDM